MANKNKLRIAVKNSTDESLDVQIIKPDKEKVIAVWLGSLKLDKFIVTLRPTVRTKIEKGLYGWFKDSEIVEQKEFSDFREAYFWAVDAISPLLDKQFEKYGMQEGFAVDERDKFVEIRVDGGHRDGAIVIHGMPASGEEICPPAPFYHQNFAGVYWHFDPWGNAYSRKIAYGKNRGWVDYLPSDEKEGAGTYFRKGDLVRVADKNNGSIYVVAKTPCKSGIWFINEYGIVTVDNNSEEGATSLDTDYRKVREERLVAFLGEIAPKSALAYIQRIFRGEIEISNQQMKLLMHDWSGSTIYKQENVDWFLEEFSYHERLKREKLEKSGFVLDNKYKMVQEESQGLVAVSELYLDSHEDAAFATVDHWGACGQWAYIDKSGKEVIPPLYGVAYPHNKQGHAIVSKAKWEYRADWKQRNNKDEDFAGYWSEDYNSFGIIDTEGNEVIPCIYDEVHQVENSDRFYYVIRDDGENDYEAIFDIKAGQEILKLDSHFCCGYMGNSIYISDEGYLVLEDNLSDDDKTQISIYDFAKQGWIVKKQQVGEKREKRFALTMDGMKVYY